MRPRAIARGEPDARHHRQTAWSGFNEAASNCSRRMTVEPVAIVVVDQASMRPRAIARGEKGGAAGSKAGKDRFNEAASNCSRRKGRCGRKQGWKRSLQ